MAAAAASGLVAASGSVAAIGRMKRPGISKVCQWIKTSWDAVKEDIIIKSFKKCGISNALDGEEDDLIYEDSSSESSSVHCDFEDSSEDEEFLGFPDSSDF
ncbi:hypothetical protein KIL84_001306 [Mauremys mutica]|uniref:Uncharacterized protein n=1 Tax=Mauremys mutica TaxID=74926 RepID=A0A9D3X018_9SAUR|nr:hypothetical protein KIL84_001306 [Mauremys mutica]